MPSIPSNEWFSIISTTTCSIFSMLGVPAGRCGNGRLSGRLICEAASAIGLAQAGSPLAASTAAPPAAAPSTVRRVSAVAGVAAGPSVAVLREGSIPDAGYTREALGDA